MTRMNLVLALIVAGAIGANGAQIYNNGPYVTGTMSTGEPRSEAQDTGAGGNTAGLNMANAAFQAADDFVVPDGQTWTLSNLKVYGYQTGATANTFDGIYVQIYDTLPVDNNTVPIWGDFTTNRFVSSTFTGVYRTFLGDNTSKNRMVMEVNGDISAAPKLGPGHYWVAWGTTGTLASGPWIVPVTPSPAGANAMQRPVGTGIYQPARTEVTTGSGNWFYYDMVFALDGEISNNLAVFLMTKAAPRYWGFFNTDGFSFSTWNRVMNSGVPVGWTVKSFGDFDNDGHKDALLRNDSTGRLGVWSLMGAMIQSWHHLMNLPLSMKVVGAGDFDGDGFADVVVQDAATRAMAFVPVTAGFMTGTPVPFSQVPMAGSTPVAVGDLSGDGMPDVLVNDGVGHLYLWVMGPAGAVTSKTFVSYTSPNWSVVGFGDADSDGDNDMIVSVVSTSRVGAFIMNGTAIQSWHNIGIVDLAASDLLGAVNP